MGQATKITGTNVVVRHLKFRPGKDQANPGSATNDGIWITGNNVIVDHVSVSWHDDEGISSSDGAGACAATYRTTNTWSGGFQGEVTVKAGSAAITGWTVKWSGQTVNQAWNGRLTTSGTNATVTNESYNGALAANASVTFGFIASGTASTPALTCTSP